MTRPAPLDALADALAVYRVTRLVTADTITEPLRDRFIESIYASQGRRGWATRQLIATGWEGDRPGTLQPGAWSHFGRDGDPHPPKPVVLVSCRWCAGFWISVAVAAARRLIPRAWRPVGDALALSALAALIAGLEKD